MIIAATGHRPSKIGGYILPNPTYIHICKQLDKTLRKLMPEKCISGMALGVDQYFANVCVRLGIPFVAAVPFEGQESAWPEASQKTFRHLLKLACEIVIVSPGGYAAVKMQTRNAWMVDHCDQLIAVYNNDPTGGTANCVKYAKSQNKDIIIIDPSLPHKQS